MENKKIKKFVVHHNVGEKVKFPKTYKAIFKETPITKPNGVLNRVLNLFRPKEQAKRDLFEVKRRSGKANDESSKLIVWSAARLEDKDFFKRVTQEVKDLVDVMYSPAFKKQLIKNLENKMHNGALEYGRPQRDVTKIRKEMMEEALDLLGWKMLQEFEAERKSG